MLTRQEMFDRACVGLKSQDFERCVANDVCVYGRVGADGREEHCAWGWVDPYGTKGFANYGDVFSLRNGRAGLAAELPEEDVFRGTRESNGFAVALQVAHDTSTDRGDMVANLRYVATRFDLSAAALDGC